MENEQLVVPFEIEKIHRNLLERVVHKLRTYTKAVINFIFRTIISIIGILFLFPLTVLVVLRKIINNDKTKVFKVSSKMGKNGKVFPQITFYCKDDNFLMKSGISHYPEIINVFLGQMQFVGPKAYSPEDKERMGEYYSYIIQHKPGVTGVNQISAYKKLSFTDRLDNDFRYHYRKNWLLDLKILLITFLVTLRKKDTYANLGLQIGRSSNDFRIIFTQTIKRTVDIIGGFMGILLIIPLTIFVKIGNMVCGDFGKIFYTQERIGKNGKIFKIYKYRSMVENADEKLKELLENDPVARKEFKENQKLKNDPRITKMGSFLRKSSIDEIPQLINVFKGDMSLVGPRPYLPREKEDMGQYYDLIIQSKPGITGLWQVSGRSKTTFDTRMRFDRQYNREKGLVTDTKILLKTVGVVLKGEGAE